MTQEENEIAMVHRLWSGQRQYQDSRRAMMRYT